MALQLIVVVILIILFMALSYLYADSIGDFIYKIINYLKGEDKNE